MTQPTSNSLNSTQLQLPQQPHSEQPTIHFCSFCRKTGELKKCGACYNVAYCSIECQKGAWKVHKFVCKKASSENEECVLGLTPSHIRALEGRGVTPNKVLSQFGGTPQDLAELLRPAPAKDELVARLLDGNGRVRPISQEEFQEMSGGITYIPGWKTTLKQFIPILQEATTTAVRDGITVYDGTHRDDKNKLLRFEKNPPELLFQVDPLFNGFGIAGKKKINAGEFICTFGGEVESNNTDLSHEAGLRKSETVNPAHFSSEGAFINDGFPNSGRTAVMNYRGLPVVPMMMAFSEIEPGETIYSDYGIDHAVKFGI